MPMPPPDKDQLDAIGQFSWQDRTLVALVTMAAFGYAFRFLVSGEPFNLRRFAGEMGISVMGAVGLYAAGIMQGMSIEQVMLLGIAAALGWLRLAEWLTKAALAVKTGGGVK